MPVIADTYIPSVKTGELIIYIASRLQDKPTYGATLLGKALCLIDSMNYLRTGSPISDFEYIKQEFGPTPDPKRYLSIRDKLEISGELQRIESDFFGRKQIRYEAKRQPQIGVFEKEELVLINDVIESLGSVSASQISDYTHSFIAWIFAEQKEKLPFYTFLLSSKEPDSEDYTWAESMIDRHESKNQ